MISGFRYISTQCIQKLGSPVTSIKNLQLKNYRSLSLQSKPVKLAFISYESMKDVTQTSTLFPVIIMHGLLGSKNNWNSLSKTIHKQTGRKSISNDKSILKIQGGDNYILIRIKDNNIIKNHKNYQQNKNLNPIEIRNKIKQIKLPVFNGIHNKFTFPSSVVISWSHGQVATLKPVLKNKILRVITVDARNHGDSPHSADMSYDHMSEDIVQLIKDLNVEKAVLIGHSMGGSTMMYVALNYPGLVEKLIVVDMSPVRISPSLTEMIKLFHAMKTVTLDGTPTLSKARKMADEQLSLSVHSERIRQFLLMNLVEAETGTYKWRVNLPVLEQNFATNIAVFPRAEGKVFAGPTLFIGGEESDYLKKEDHERIRNFFPTAEFMYIPEAGHWVHVDKPVEFLNAATAFIKEP